MMDKNEFKGLIDRYIAGQLSLQEEAVLLKWLEEDPGRELLADIMDEQLSRREPSRYVYPEAVERIRRAVLKGISPAGEARTAHWATRADIATALPTIAAHRDMKAPAAGKLRLIHRMGWAAAAVLLLTAGAWLWLASQKKQQNARQQTAALSAHDRTPAKEEAILTLADGSTITLDSLGNGMVANERGTRLILENGRLAYETSASSTAGYNNITTPRGRQFRLVLPDGSKVWLNAASSLRYPTFFNGEERGVELSGEAYFEIEKNAKMPFRVKLKNWDAGIQVLGTRFNVNAYTDEPGLKTTLVEGGVKFVSNEAHPQEVVLEPGQQAELREQGNIAVRQVNIEQVLAWTNNEFRFNDDDLESVMRQLARWYDVKVVYEGVDKSLRFGGVISREENMSVVLNKLEQIGIVRFRVENKTIYVRQITL